MNNKLSEIYLEKNKDVFNSFDKEKLIENFKYEPASKKYSDIAGAKPHDYGWYGQCPKEYPRGLNLQFETVRDNESRSICNSSCERNYSYREYQKNISANNCNQQHRADWSIGKYRHFHNVYFYKGDPEEDKDVVWRNIHETCKPGEGNCPQDCEYEYSKCDDKCKKYLTIHKKSKNAGKPCPDPVRDCIKGVECPFDPIDCNETYGECHILNESDVPSNLKGKCGKANQIYQNPKHGGKSCVNTKYKSCNEGEGNCPKDCDGYWRYCNQDCESTFVKTVDNKNGGKCPPDNIPKPECKPGMGQCVANIDCEGEWSECSSYPDCEKVYNHNIKKSGKGINCRYRDGYTKKCDSCEAPAPPPKEPGVVEDIDSTPVDDLKPEPTPTPAPAQESNESNTMVIYAMGAIILLLIAYIMMSGTKEIVVVSE